MTADHLRDLVRRDPFVPFRLILSGGGHYEVRNPELAVVMKSEIFVAFPDGERWAHVPLLHIAAIETAADGRERKITRRRRRRE